MADTESKNIITATIESGCKVIGCSVFADHSNLTSVVIPDSVTSIGDYAFFGCESLTSIEIPDSVTTIREYAFSYCEKITSVIIPKSVTVVGDFSFEEAVNAFKGAVIGAQKAGADLIFFETFSDLYECKAAITAAKENSDLPIAVSLTFDENGRTLTGANAQTAAFYLSSVGADIIGVNCGLGPDAMEPIAIELASFGIPMIVNANAGLPKIADDGSTYFDIAPSRFTSFANTLYENGVTAVGGCCGTTPEFIREMIAATRDLPIPDCA